MKYNGLYRENSDYIVHYRCVVNGNEVVALGDNRKSIRRKCLSFARRGLYVELWYTNSDGVSFLLEYWN